MMRTQATAAAANDDSLSNRILRAARRIAVSFAVGLSAASFLSVCSFLLLREHEITHADTRAMAIRVEADLGGIGAELIGLATSPLMWTGLSDSMGREAYMIPMIRSMNHQDGRNFFIVDYRGRQFFDEKDTSVGPQLKADISDALDTGKNRMIVIKPGDGSLQTSTRLAVIVPVYYPLTGTTIGAAIGLYDPVRSLGKQIASNPEILKVGFSAANPAASDDELYAWFFKGSTRLNTPEGFDGTIYLEQERSPWRLVQTLLLSGILALLLALAFLRWATRKGAELSNQLTQQLDRLTEYSRRLGRKDEIPLPDFGPSDERNEIRMLATTLSSAISEQRALADRLRPAALVISNAQEGMLITDSNGRITDVNPAFEQMMGFSREEVIGKPAGMLYMATQNIATARKIQSSLARDGHWRGTANYLRKDGKGIDTLTSISSMYNESNVFLGNVAVFADISELRRAQQALELLATTDTLTGLPNFSQFNRLLEKELIRASQQQYAVAIFFIDLDHFKSINDTLGHAGGDRVLQSVSRKLGKWVGEDCVLSRRSGDEFIAYAALRGDPQASLRALANQPTHFTIDLSQPQSARLNVTMSVGICVYPTHKLSGDELFRAADTALYAAKERGRNCVAIFTDEMGEKARRRFLIKARLAEAIDHQRLTVAYQPQVRLDTGRITDFEALVRWRDDVLGEVSPAEFIPIAEEAGLVGGIGNYVMQQVMADLPRVRERFANARIAINVSPHQLNRWVFMQNFIDVMRAQPEIARCLEIEVTETVIAELAVDLVDQLLELNTLGCRIAIDDFGTGHSSLARLYSLPIGKIKIDQFFVQHSDNPHAKEIIRAVLALAGAFNITATAEGIETAEQLHALAALGCQSGQGYLFSAPLPLQQLLELPAAPLNWAAAQPVASDLN